MRVRLPVGRSRSPVLRGARRGIFDGRAMCKRGRSRSPAPVEGVTRGASRPRCFPRCHDELLLVSCVYVWHSMFSERRSLSPVSLTRVPGRSEPLARRCACPRWQSRVRGMCSSGVVFVSVRGMRVARCQSVCVCGVRDVRRVSDRDAVSGC